MFFFLLKARKKKKCNSLKFAGSYFTKCEKVLISCVTGRSRGHCRSYCVYRKRLSLPVSNNRLKNDSK